MTVNVLHHHRRFVDKNPDRQRQASERHDVDRLTRAPQGDDRGQQGKRNRRDHDERTPPVAQKEEHHHARQDRA